jgi:hypothetical protein
MKVDKMLLPLPTTLSAAIGQNSIGHRNPTLSRALAPPHPPVGRSNRHHLIETRIRPAHTVAPAGKRQSMVFFTFANA